MTKPSSSHRWIAAGAALAGAGVVLGAFGAHALKSRLTPEMLAIFETGARYHMVHALALIGVGLADARWPHIRLGRVGWMMVIGIAIFSGSLYALALTGVRWLGAVTPFGGVAFITAWAWFAIAVLRAERGAAR